jgi:hypothetical protein
MVSQSMATIGAEVEIVGQVTLVEMICQACVPFP